MKLTSIFPEREFQTEDEHRQQMAGFRAFAGKLRDQLMANPAIDEEVHAEKGQKTAIDKAAAYFKKLAVKQLGDKKTYTDDDLLKTDAGKVWSGICDFGGLVRKLETISDPTTEPDTARFYWAQFKQDFNPLIETNEYHDAKSFSDALHDLLMGPLTFDSIDSDEVKLASELAQLVQNVEQEAELLNYQTQIYEAKNKIDRFKDDEKRFSRDVGFLIEKAAQKNIELKNLPGQLEDAHWDIQLSQERLDKHKAGHAEMQKKWKAASEELAGLQDALSAKTMGLDKLKEEQKAHFEGEFGINAFRANYKKHEDEVKKRLTALRDESTSIAIALQEDDKSRLSKETSSTRVTRSWVKRRRRY